jgi:hypothetical protein
MAANFPMPPQKRYSSRCFPTDLIQNDREFYTDISFVEYKASMQVNNGPSAMGGMGVKLPMPRRINDVTNINWAEISATEMAGQLASGGRGAAMIAAAGAGGSVGTGLALNPMMFMQFQRPSYKEHTLSWTLAPSNQRDSDELKDIINAFKKASLPTLEGGGLLLGYPNIATIQFKPDKYLFKLKPCAIISVQVDYSGAGMPSFFKSDAPTVVNLTVMLKEIQLWNRNNYEM